MTTVYEYKREGVTVYADGPDKQGVFTFQMDQTNNGVIETNFYQRRKIGWFFLFGDTWHPTKHAPRQVVTARIQYGSGEF